MSKLFLLTATLILPTPVATHFPTKAYPAGHHCFVSQTNDHPLVVRNCDLTTGLKINLLRDHHIEIIAPAYDSKATP